MVPSTTTAVAPENSGRDYAALARSLVATLAAHKREAAHVVAADTALAHEYRALNITRAPATITIIDAHLPDVVTLKYAQPNATFDVMLLRSSRGQWHVASLERESTAPPDTTGTGNVGDHDITVGVSVSAPGGGSIDLGGRTQTPLLRWEFSGDRPANNGDLNGLCSAPITDPSVPRLGFVYHRVARDFANHVVIDDYVCVPFTQPGTQPPPPPPPALPTLEEAWRTAHLPTPLFAIDPRTRGVAGLDTRIRTNAPAPITISASVRTYAITGTATPFNQMLAVDGIAWTLVDNPAHYMFQTKGLHRIAIAVIWHGTAVFTGPDLPSSITTDIGDATITVTRSYRVDEIRSVLESPPTAILGAP